jgi:uncharacterized protein YecE (DUF72 family)
MDGGALCLLFLGRRVGDKSVIFNVGILEVEAAENPTYPMLLSGIVHIGCAGWNVPPNTSACIEPDDNAGHGRTPNCSTIAEHNEASNKKIKSHLERYATFFSAVEINTSFYRPHLPITYAKWHKTVPSHFRFSVKFPRAITHGLRLQNCGVEVGRFLDEVANFEKSLGCLLIQLPPSLRFNAGITDDFFTLIQDRFDVPLALEPRHPSWFDSSVFRLLEHRGITLVHADPRPVGVTIAKLPQIGSMAYFRLHGSPVTYRSSYDQRYLDNLLCDILLQHSCGKYVWCIFDNTASGAAFPNALALRTSWRRGMNTNAEK